MLSFHVQTTFNVGMTCSGCAGAVTRILKKINGVELVDCNVESRIVKVTHSNEADQQAMLTALKKWGDASGKTVELASK